MTNDYNLCYTNGLETIFEVFGPQITQPKRRFQEILSMGGWEILGSKHGHLPRFLREFFLSPVHVLW